MKTILHKAVLGFICLFLLATTCEKLPQFDKRLVIDNNSNHELFILKGITYPDTAIINERPLINNDFIIKPNTRKVYANPLSWEDDFNQIPSDTVMFFLFDNELLSYASWDSVSNNYLILKRYDLSLEDLQGMNWTITYP